MKNPKLRFALLFAIGAVAGFLIVGAFHSCEHRRHVSPPSIDVPAVPAPQPTPAPKPKPGAEAPSVPLLPPTYIYAPVNPRVAAVDEKPTLALLTADWCGACKQFERQVLPAMKAMLAERQIAYEEVDVDRQAAEAEKLFADTERTLPQLVLYTKSDGACEPIGRLSGRHTVKEIEAFLERPVSRSEKGAGKLPRPWRRPKATIAGKARSAAG